MKVRFLPRNCRALIAHYAMHSFEDTREPLHWDAGIFPAESIDHYRRSTCYQPNYAASPLYNTRYDPRLTLAYVRYQIISQNVKGSWYDCVYCPSHYQVLYTDAYPKEHARDRDQTMRVVELLFGDGTLSRI